MVKVNRDEADKIVLELQTLRSRAHGCGLHVTAHTLHRAMNAAGWEIAGDVEQAGVASRKHYSEKE